MTADSQETLRGQACAVRWNLRPFIDGAYCDSASDGVAATVNPATGEKLADMAAGSTGDVERAVASARRAFEDGRWSSIGAATRRAVLSALADGIVERAEELALLDCLEIGKPISQARFEATALAPAFARFCAETIDKLFGVVGNTEPGVLAFSRPEARGVVAAISPWNFPLVNAVIKVLPALAAGNSVILKPSEMSSASALKLAEIALAAGIPPGVFNVVTGLGSTVGAALAVHPDIDFLSFTGSTQTGLRLMTLRGSSTVRPLLLECGGKSPSVVFDDIEDVAAVAARVCADALWNQGQLCVARTRLIVHERIAPALLEAVRAQIGAFVPGDPLDPDTGFGVLAGRTHWQRVAEMVARGVSAGADLVAGGLPSDQGGCAMAPMVLEPRDADNPLWLEEVFGPVVAMRRFSTCDEAFRLANESGYGLAATIWTRNLDIAHQAARTVRAGEVIVRSVPDDREGAGFSLPQEAMGGSGFGVETGIEGIRSYMNWKKVEFHTATGF
ncbi:MAG: aldehyde dehydrogenase family protein [Sphingobium sp.]